MRVRTKTGGQVNKTQQANVPNVDDFLQPDKVWPRCRQLTSTTRTITPESAGLPRAALNLLPAALLCHFHSYIQARLLCVGLFLCPQFISLLLV